VLDTNVYCDFAEGVPQTVETIADLGKDLLLPAPVIGELSFGFLKGSRREYNEQKLRDFIRLMSVEVIIVDEEVARKYGIIYLALVNKGQKIPVNDVWIAACCMSVGGTLLTRDRHFEVVDQIDKIILTDERGSER